MRIENFLSQIKQVNVSRQYLFEFQIPKFGEFGLARAGEVFKILAKAGNIPEKKVSKITVPYMGRLLTVPGEIEFSDWTVTVINDEKYITRNFFELWMDEISKTDTGLRGNRSLFGDIFVTQLGNDFEASGDRTPIREYGLVDAYPVVLGPIEFSADAVTVSQDYKVTFEFQYFKTLTPFVDSNVFPDNPIIS